MVATLACAVTEILIQRSTEEASFVRGLVTSQGQLATEYQIYTYIVVSVVYDIFKKYFFHTCLLL